MSEYKENPHKFLSISSSEDRDSTESSEARGSFEEFYEQIEAPKFVDFTVPDDYRPDDRYWFCSRVGCDLKHEEEMDSEEIYKNFVLRVMAARSPNIRLKKALDRNASRIPRKCPLSAPPKPSRTRLSKMVITSSISEKMVNGGKKKVVRPLLKPNSTPLNKTKPVAAKYLTTPRNKKCVDNQSSFRSVRIMKTNTAEVPKSRTAVAKTLNFNKSPEKVKRLETCDNLRTPVTKLCEGMSKLEISKRRKVALVNSGKSCKKGMNLKNSSVGQVSSKKAKGKPEEPRKSERSTECSKVSGKLSKCINKSKLLGDNYIDVSNNVEVLNVEEELIVEDEFDECQKSKQEEAYSSSVVPVSINGTDFAAREKTSSEGNNSKSQYSTDEENNNKNSGDENNTSEAERDHHECTESDDKENDAASDHNRILDENSIQNGTKPFGMREKRTQLKKVAAQAKEKKNMKEGLISSSPVIKPNKPKTTNPKPFRLRTDERGILKEATTLDKRTNHVALETDGSNLSTKSERQLKDDVQLSRGNDILRPKMVPTGQEKSKLVLRRNECHDEKKIMNSPSQCNAMKRLERFRKTTSSPLSKKSSIKHQGIEKTTINEDMISFLVPGKKLEVIHETTSPDASELSSTIKINSNDGQQQQACDDASRSSSRRKKAVTVCKEPNFHRIHVPKSCAKKLK